MKYSDVGNDDEWTTMMILAEVQKMNLNFFTLKMKPNFYKKLCCAVLDAFFLG